MAHSHHADEIVPHPKQDIKHKTFLGKEFLIAKTTSKVTHATQEDKIIQKERTLNAIPTPHNQTLNMNQV